MRRRRPRLPWKREVEKIDRERLRDTFDDPALGWIIERLRRRLERGRGLTGTITLRQPATEQRAALDRLLGRPPSRGAALALDLGKLEGILRHAELAASLSDAVVALTGPVIDERARQSRLDARWERLFAEYAESAERPTVRAWLAERRTLLLTRRFSAQDPKRGRELLAGALEVVRRLPARGLALAELAVDVTGDSHALDAGQPLGTLVISAAARLGRLDDWHGAAARRDAWASAGVLLDELSAPALVLNLRSDSRSLTGQVLGLHRQAGEPYRLSTRQMLRYPATFLPVPTVYVCENPAVVAAAANRLGTRSAPLVCLEGQPTTAARLLLDRLAAAGIRLAYHGDFDWGGVRIANLVMKRHGAVPWRFTTDDYLKIGSGKELAGRPAAAIWDPRLEAAMLEAGRAVHEEQVIEELLADLRG